MTNVVSTLSGRKPSVEWETPQELFDLLHAEFGFTLDPCATPENAKCPRYFTREQDGLAQSWAGERVFLNPPYGSEAPLWVEKAVTECRTAGALVVCLIVPRTDTRWWHEHCAHAAEIRLLKGRVRFRKPGNPADRPQDPSAVVVFDPDAPPGRPTRLTFWDWQAKAGRGR